MIWIAALGGCTSAPSLQCPERFYLQGPVRKTFEFERAFPEQSWIKGTLILDVEKVDLAHDNDDTYTMLGAATLSSQGMTLRFPKEARFSQTFGENIERKGEIA